MPDDLIREEVVPTFRGADGREWVVVFASFGEALSSLYEASIVLASGDPSASPDALLDAAATFSLARGARIRRLHGIVSSVEDLGATASQTYVQVTLRPALWTLSQRSDSRIFQGLPVVAIVREVLRDAGLYQRDGALVAAASLGVLPPREYCVQYRETDLDFVMRLLQEQGVPFYFTHDGDVSETLVLAEEGHVWPTLATHMNNGRVTVADARVGVTSSEVLRGFEVRRAVRPTRTTLRDYDFTRPRAAMDMTTSHASERGGRGLYEYPARTTLHAYGEGSLVYAQHDGSEQARVRQQAQRVDGVVARGNGDVTGAMPGRRFEVTGHRRDVPPSWLITRVVHTVNAWADVAVDARSSEHIAHALRTAGVDLAADLARVQRYANRLEAIPTDAPFRPARVTPRPIVHGAQTARVVGPPGEEIHVDPHARVKVQFHWDRAGAEDERSSCWIRVAQNWAGPGWGFQFVPRIGMEVVVTFLEGDPDRPLITGCVYNGENARPYELPAEKTRSAIKTNSSPTTGGYNELRFEDAAGREQVYLQAERDHDVLVKNDQSITVRRHRTKVVEGREKNTVVLDRATMVQGNETKRVVGNQDVEVHGEIGITAHADATIKHIGDGAVIIQCGESSIVMSPTTIVLTARRIRLDAAEVVEIEGGVVKINCEGS